MLKIEHIGIAVHDLEEAEKLYEKLLGSPSYKREEVESEKVVTSFFRSGPNKVELLAATEESSAIHKYLEKKGEGIHHIAFAVENIRAEMARLKAEGFTLLNDEPKPGADNKLICFVHPKGTRGVLIELCQERPHPQ
jgi:methylmalonyl-CoA/ethylmalonyl-CoA epimerase